MSEDPKPYWLSWEHRGGDFTLVTPWWISGYTADNHPVVSAAIMARNEAEARMKVHDSYTPSSRDTLPSFRFAEERPADWSPFSDRFPRASWMRWI